MGTHIIIVGSLTDGFRFIGPFKTWDQATEATNLIDDATEVVPLESLDEVADFDDES